MTAPLANLSGFARLTDSSTMTGSHFSGGDRAAGFQRDRARCYSEAQLSGVSSVNQDKVSQLRHLLRDIVKIIFNSIRGYHVDETDWNIIVGDVPLSPFKDSVFRSRRMQPGGIDGNGNQIFRFCRFDLMNHLALHLARICLWLH